MVFTVEKHSNRLYCG